MGFNDFVRRLSGPTYVKLPWYADYNAVKHDREVNFAQATLKNVIDAMAGVYVLLRAHYGLGRLDSEQYVPFDAAVPEYDLEQYYIPPHMEKNAEWRAIRCPL